MGCIPSKSTVVDTDVNVGSSVAARSRQRKTPCKKTLLHQRCPSPDLTNDDLPPWLSGHKVYAVREVEDGQVILSEKQHSTNVDLAVPGPQHPDTPASIDSLADEFVSKDPKAL